MSSSIYSRCALFILMLLSGCACLDKADNLTEKRGTLVRISSSPSLDVNAVNIAISVLHTGYGANTSVLPGNRYAVAIQRIVYKTLTPDGRLIDVSGVVALPLKPAGKSSPLISYQHPTILQDGYAPSTFADPVMISLAGSGFIVAMPDYIGYATSTTELHPYLHAQSLAGTTVDMLRAARQLLAQKNISDNGQLFLMGYSEGGYATLATQKEMEQHLAAEFPLVASMPGAGPYDISGTARYSVGLASNPVPELLGFFFKAYDFWYGWNSINSIYKAPYNTVIATGYDGSIEQATLRAALSSDSATLFNSTFRSGFLGGGESAIKADIAKNDIYNWAPITPTHLFHGQDDTIAPYANSTTAFAAMTKAGSTSVVVINCTTPAGVRRDHFECFGDYLSQEFAWFVPLAFNL